MMNVLNPSKQAALRILLKNEISHHEISRKAKIDRKTIRKYSRQINVTSSSEGVCSRYLPEAMVATGLTSSLTDNAIREPMPG